MALLADIEDAILARCRETLGARLRAYEPLPGQYGNSAEALKRSAARAPGVFSAWLGASQDARDRRHVAWDSLFGLYVVTRHAGGAVARLRGDSTEIGTLDALPRLAVALHGWQPPLVGADGDEVGTVQVQRADSLWSEAVFELGLSVGEIRLTVPHGMSEGDMDGLDAFITFAADVDITSAADDVEAEVLVTLPQE